MKKIIVLLLAFAFVLCSCGKASVTGSANDDNIEDDAFYDSNENYECVYSNDFSAGVGSEFRILCGSFMVKDGTLRSGESQKGGYSTLLFDVGDYSDFVYEVDYVDYPGGGLLFLCDGDSAIDGSSDAFCGYAAYIESDSAFGAFGCSNSEGAFSGNIADGVQIGANAGANLRLRVRVSGDYIVYTIRDIATGAELYRYDYIKGSNEEYDESPYQKGMIGLRIYNDGGVGGIDNLRLLVSKKPMVDLKSTLSVGKIADIKVRIAELEHFIFLMSESDGYALSYDSSIGQLVLYSYSGGDMFFVSKQKMMLNEGAELSFHIMNESERLVVYVDGAEPPAFEIFHDAQVYDIYASAWQDVVMRYYAES